MKVFLEAKYPDIEYNIRTGRVQDQAGLKQARDWFGSLTMVQQDNFVRKYFPHKRVVDVMKLDADMLTMWYQEGRPLAESTRKNESDGMKRLYNIVNSEASFLVSIMHDVADAGVKEWYLLFDKPAQLQLGPEDGTTIKLYAGSKLTVKPGRSGEVFINYDIGTGRTISHACMPEDILDGRFLHYIEAVFYASDFITLHRGPGQRITPFVENRKKNETTTSGTAKQVASTIVQQLGGNRFYAMTGTKPAYYGTDEKHRDFIMFKLTRSKLGTGMFMKVLLDAGRDTYVIQFIKQIGMNEPRMVKEIDDVYADQLQSIFTQYTGLYTSL